MRSDDNITSALKPGHYVKAKPNTKLRHCATCDIRLSMYNPERYCSIHTPRRILTART